MAPPFFRTPSLSRRGGVGQDHFAPDRLPFRARGIGRSGLMGQSERETASQGAEPIMTAANSDPPGDPTMSTDAEPRPSHRLWLPLLVLLAAPLAAAAVWYWPSTWEHDNRFVTVMALALASVFVLGFWMLFLSRFPTGVRLGAVAFVVGAGVLFLTVGVREVHFSGDMVPVFTFFWEKTHDDLLEEDRRRQAEADEPQADEARKSFSYSDFPAYRGWNGAGLALGAELSRDWSAQSPREVWRQPVGGGYAQFAVRDGFAVTIEQRRDEEAVVCYDAATGRERWAYKYPAHFRERLGGPGPRATPAISSCSLDGKYRVQVFSVGAAGKFVCLDFVTGKLEWEADILKDNENLPWGMAASPLVRDKETLVIVAPGAQTPTANGRAVIAYNRYTGEEFWASGSHRGAYSSPMYASSARRPQTQVLVFDGDGLTSYDRHGGKELWHYPWVAMPPQYINVAQPLVLEGDRVFISSGYGVGCAMLQMKEADGQWSVETLWKNKFLRCKFTSPVYHNGFIYGLDEGVLTCLDEKTGEPRWREGRYGHGQLLLCNGLLLILSESGDLVLVEATPDAHRELGKVAALEGKTWNPPALASGYAVIRNHNEMACYELPGKKVKAKADSEPRD
jgi:outer membrane protein assembly factor BamB